MRWRKKPMLRRIKSLPDIRRAVEPLILEPAKAG